MCSPRSQQQPGRVWKGTWSSTLEVQTEDVRVAMGLGCAFLCWQHLRNQSSYSWVCLPPCSQALGDDRCSENFLTYSRLLFISQGRINGNEHAGFQIPPWYNFPSLEWPCSLKKKRRQLVSHDVPCLMCTESCESGWLQGLKGDELSSLWLLPALLECKQPSSTPKVWKESSRTTHRERGPWKLWANRNHWKQRLQSERPMTCWQTPHLPLSSNKNQAVEAIAICSNIPCPGLGPSHLSAALERPRWSLSRKKKIPKHAGKVAGRFFQAQAPGKHRLILLFPYPTLSFLSPNNAQFVKAVILLF